jgi:hypothetical protein
MSSFELRQTEPNKLNVAKTFVINNMTEKSVKQTQRPYPTCYQLLTAILAPNFREIWMEATWLTTRNSATGERDRQMPG